MKKIFGTIVAAGAGLLLLSACTAPEESVTCQALSSQAQNADMSLQQVLSAQDDEKVRDRQLYNMEAAVSQMRNTAHKADNKDLSKAVLTLADAYGKLHDAGEDGVEGVQKALEEDLDQEKLQDAQATISETCGQYEQQQAPGGAPQF